MHKLEQGGILISSYREIVTKAVVAKGKKSFVSEHNISLDRNLSTILGCWVINHNFNGKKVNNDIIIEGDYDVNIWYSYDNDRLTDVIRENNKYREVIHMREVDTDDEEIIVRSLKQPNCLKVDIVDGGINYSIEKELGIELVSNVKVKIEAADEEDPYDEIFEEDKSIDDIKEDFIDTEVLNDKQYSFEYFFCWCYQKKVDIYIGIRYNIFQ